MFDHKFIRIRPVLFCCLLYYPKWLVSTVCAYGHVCIVTILLGHQSSYRKDILVAVRPRWCLQLLVAMRV